VSQALVKFLAGHSALTKHIECTELSKEDFNLVCMSSASVSQLSSQPHLRRILKSPKMLDVLLSGQLSENRVIAGEADLIDWWWEQQVRGAKAIAAEENLARLLATRMADELCTELAPDAVVGNETAANALVKNRVLRHTRDGRLRFNHDLLADWSRVMYLRSLGDGALAFMLTHAENPPWLRAIRLLSQHLLERIADTERWRAVVVSCSAKPKADEEPSAENLQVLDPWLEGIAHCVDAKQILDSLKADLFANDGWLLRRFISRLLHVGTIPDPVIQDRFRQMDSTAVETAGILYRLPQARLWTPVINYLTENKAEATDYVPVELAEIASMWARLEEYLQTPWPTLADIVLLNGEKELRREVAGEYRWDRGARSLGDGNKSRINIYTAAVQAASQFPDRAAKLVLKAAGRAPWDEGDVGDGANEGWRGEWHDRSHFGQWEVYIKEPPESWLEGPTRDVSNDFFHAWFESNAALALYKKRPDAAREATLAFLISWPKSEIRKGHGHYGHGVDHYGFTFQADQMHPAFWTKGNFLVFLRENWRPALELIIRLTNFATDRYQDWWPYETRVVEVIILTPKGEVRWKGNHQVYAWYNYHMNTAQVVTCALMALEKWLDEQIEAGKTITEVVQLLYQQGRSLALAGVLISIGKRHPKLFVDDLKPLLFLRDIYMHDMQATRNYLGGSYWPQDGKVVNNLRRDWDQLPGRKRWLKDACCEWLLTKPELEIVMGEVSAAWRQEAQKFPDGSDDRTMILRWAADFDRSLWKEVTLPDGQQVWQNTRPEELRDVKSEQAHIQRQKLLTLPFQCSDVLSKRQTLTDAQLEGIWQELQNWTPFEQLAGENKTGDELTTEFLDHRHARAGLLAVLLCLGSVWLQQYPDRRKWLETEVRKLLANQPSSPSFGPDDIHDDCDTFLSRCVVRCWAVSPSDFDWRGHVASFVTAYRYRTVQHLFAEAFETRKALGSAYHELEAFALEYAVVRRKATQLQFLRTQQKTDAKEIQQWGEKWLRRFAQGKGPKWVADWSKIEFTDKFPHEHQVASKKKQKREELYRRDYGLDMGIILASFGHFPALGDASDLTERAHWLAVCQEMLAAYCRTLPSSGDTQDDVEWHFDMWRYDEQIFEILARRIFECTPAERPALWRPIIDLPPAAHHHIARFLSALFIESFRAEPPLITELRPIWGEISDYVFSTPKWLQGRAHDCQEVLKNILLYGSSGASSGEEFWSPLVDDLRPYFKKYVNTLAHDAHEQSSFAHFLITKAGQSLLIDAFIWLQPSWTLASDWFWKTAVERNHFSNLLEHAWRHNFKDIRANPDALKAFKTLTLKLAVCHVPIALEVQQQI
jgi:hypothetical protein